MSEATIVEVTPAMIEKAARELIVQDAAKHLRDCYGEVSIDRARKYARAMLEHALEIDLND